MTALLVVWLVTGAAGAASGEVPATAPAPSPELVEPEVFPRVAVELALTGAVVDLPAWPWPSVVSAVGAHVEAGARYREDRGVVGVLNILQSSSRTLGPAFATLGAGLRFGKDSHVTAALGLTWAPFAPPPPPPAGLPPGATITGSMGFGLTALVDAAWVVAAPLALHAQVAAAFNGEGPFLLASLGVGLALF